MRDESDNNNTWNYDYIRLAWDSGFHFTNQKADVLINLNSLSLVDIEKTINDRDIANVERHISTIINYNLDDEHTRILDGTFVKVFKLSQLAIQYLLFCKKYLDHTVTLLKKEIHQLNEENRNLLEENDNYKQDVLELRRKLKDVQPSIISDRTYQCNQCAKIFTSEEFLISHVKRRHENPPLIQTEADKLQMEIKELKERLNSTEKYIQHDHNVNVKLSNDDEIKERRNSFVEIQTDVEKLRIQLENQTRMMEEHKNYQEKYEKWLEIAFEKFERKQMELIEKKLIRNETKSICTQTTDNRSIETQCDVTSVDSSREILNRHEDNMQQIKMEFVKIQNDIEQEARNHFEKLEGFLEEKVSDKFDKFSKQMELFWNKVEETQSKMRTKSSSNDNSNNQPTVLYEKNTKHQQNVPRIQFVESQSSEETSSDDLPVPQTKKHFNVKESNALNQMTRESQLKLVPTKQSLTIETPKPQPRKSISHTSNKGVNIQKVTDKIRPVRNTQLNIVKSKRSLEEIESSSEEIDLKKLTAMKPSQTSTLAQRSITSLKEAAFEENVKIGLSKELEELLRGRLINLGISPDWKGLPQQSFEKALTVIKHQSNLYGKKNIKYDKTRKKLIKTVDKRAKTTSLESLLKTKESTKQAQKQSAPVSLKPEMYVEETSESVTFSSNVIYSKPKDISSKITIEQRTDIKTDEASNAAILQAEQPQKELAFSNVIGGGDGASNAQTTHRTDVLTPKHELPQESGERLKESSKAIVKKKVLFDLESLSRNSSDAEKLEAIGKVNEVKTFEKPLYIDELKNVINTKLMKDLDTSFDSFTFDDKDVNDVVRNVNNAKIADAATSNVIKEKDPDASDWDISEILN